MFYKRLIRPLLVMGDPEDTHEQTLALLSKIGALDGVLSRLYCMEDKRLQTRLGSLTFSNPVGLAGGFDKNAIAVRAVAGFGFGFMEIGAVTAVAQPGYPKPRLFRLPEDQALINRLGFNNDGAQVIADRLARIRRRCVVGINIGRNKDVPTADAVENYLAAFELVHAVADYIVVNVSSPNTPALRELQGADQLDALLSALQDQNGHLSAAKPPPEDGTRNARK